MTASRPVVAPPQLDRSISLYKLEVLALVVELGRVTRAAEELYVAQPVVTVHLQSLEEKLGVMVFERTGRTLQLSEAGQLVHRWASSTIGQLRELVDALEAHRQGRIGKVLVGASMTLGTYRLPVILAATHARRPYAEISLSTSDPESAMNAVKQGQLDFCIVIRDTDLDDPALEREIVGEEDIVLVASPDYEIPDNLRLADIARLPFVTSAAGLLRRALAEVTAKRFKNASNDALVEYGHPEAIKQGIVEGVGAGLLFRSVVATELATGILKEIPIGDLRLKLPIYAVKRRDKQLNGLQQAVWDDISRALDGSSDGLDPRAAGAASVATSSHRNEDAASRDVRIPFEKLDSRISLEKLEVFCLVVELGSTTWAAEQLRVSPATVTAHVRSLEQRFRVTLFERTGYGQRTTEQGQLVYEFAAQTMSRGRTMMRELQNLADSETGSVLIAASLSIGTFLIPGVVNAFVKSRPTSKITVRISDPDTAIRDVERGDLDFAVAILDQPIARPLLTYDYIGDEEILLVTADHGEPVADEVGVRDLADLRLIGSSQGAGVRAMVDRVLAGYGIARPRSSLELGHALSAMYAVQRGLGAALVSRSAYDGFVAQSGGIRPVPFNDARIAIPIYAVQRRDRRPTSSERFLLGEIRAKIQARSPVARVAVPTEAALATSPASRLAESPHSRAVPQRRGASYHS